MPSLILVTSLWQGRRLQAEIERLQSRISQLQSGASARSGALSTAEPTDFVHALPEAPSAVQVMQTLQQAADKEGGSVVSLQAEDHPPTDSTLGRLDLVVSIKSTYPAIIIVLQQALDRYPGATVRQFTLTHLGASAGAMPTAFAPLPGPTASQPVVEVDAHVVLSFWRRPLGVAAQMVGAAAPMSPLQRVAAASDSSPARGVRPPVDPASSPSGGH